MVTRLWAGQSRVRFLAVAGDFSFHQNVQISSGGLAVLLFRGYQGFFTVVKWERGMKLTVHPSLVPRISVSGVM